MLLDFSSKYSFPKPKTEFERQVLEFVEEWFSPSKSVKVQTSGSTGTPKIFEVEKERMCYSAKMTCDFLGLKKGYTALICLPVEYISGKMMLVRAIERRLKLIVRNPSTSPLKHLNQGIDFCAMTPLQVENSLDKIHLIKQLIIGGASVSEKLKMAVCHSLFANSQQRIYETYGMSETLSHIALKSIFPNDENYFKCLNGIEISQDERGCLVINAPKLNSEKLITNDLVELKNNGEFQFLGRMDNVINSGGAKIFPEILEALVKKIIPNEVAFIGLPDETLGQKLVLIIEGEESEAIRHKLFAIVYEKSFHRPKEVIFIENIPQTPNGKVNRLELTKQFEVL